MSRQRIFGLRQSWPSQEFSIATEYFDVATELAKVMRNYVAIEQFYVATKLARIGRIYVVTKLAHDRKFYRPQ